MSQTTAAKLIPERNPEVNGLHIRLWSYLPDLAEFIKRFQEAQFASQNRIQILLRDTLAVTSTSSSQAHTKNDNLQEVMALF